MKLIAVFSCNYNGWWFKDPSFTLDEELLDRACEETELPSITYDYCDEDGYCEYLPEAVEDQIRAEVLEFFSHYGVTEVDIEWDTFST